MAESQTLSFIHSTRSVRNLHIYRADEGDLTPDLLQTDDSISVGNANPVWRDFKNLCRQRQIQLYTQHRVSETE